MIRTRFTRDGVDYEGELLIADNRGDTTVGLYADIGDGWGLVETIGPLHPPPLNTIKAMADTITELRKPARRRWQESIHGLRHGNLARLKLTYGTWAQTAAHLNPFDDPPSGSCVTVQARGWTLALGRTSEPG